MADRNVSVAFIGKDVSLGRSARRIGSDMDGLGKKVGLFAGIGSAVGNVAANVLGSAVGKLTGFLSDSIGAASDLNETVSKVGVVFGKEAPKVVAWGKSAATSMGQSRQAAMEAAATFGNFFEAMGITRSRAVVMSESIVQLAGDLASFNNVDPAETLEALRSGLAGEVEPLRRFGVDLSDATLKQEALRLGLVKTTTGTLPASIKAQAAYALILKQTKTAQGDFARTSGGLANQQRILSARFTDLKASIGQKLLPVAVKLTQWANDTAIPALYHFGGWIDRNRESIIGFGAGFAEMAAIAIRGLALLVDQTTLAFGTIVRAADIGLGWIPTVGYGIHRAREAFDKFKTTTVASLNAAARAADHLADSLNRIKSKHVTVTATIVTKRIGGTSITAAGGTLNAIRAEGRAVGGPVRAGVPYIVGERRAELFIPRTDGTIVPSVRGGGGTTVNVTVNAGMGADGTEIGRQVVQALDKVYRTLNLKPAYT